MERKIILTGIVAAVLIAVIICAGCTSQNQGSTAVQTQGQQSSITTPPASQVTPAPTSAVTQAVQDQGLVSDSTGDAAAQAEALNETQGANPAPDSTDFGDIMP